MRLAAWMPAIRATASASPFGTPPSRSRATTAGETSTRPVAVAVRTVTSLPETSTIRAAPDSSTWVSRVLAHDSRRSSTMTSTGPPAGTSVTSSGTTSSALACARPRTRCEPGPPTGRTT